MIDLAARKVIPILSAMAGFCDTGPGRKRSPAAIEEFSVLEKLAVLERLSRRLDPGAGDRRQLLQAAQAYSEDFLSSLPENGTYRRDRGRNGLGEPLIPESPSDIAEILELFRAEVDTTGITPASGGQMGYIPGGGLYPSAIGDFLADISNRYSGVAFAGPGAAAMELALVDWMCALVGYPKTASGDLTSGGSLATLSALVAARDARGIDHARIPASCIYLTGQVHHCVGKALHVAGLKDVRRRIVSMDAHYRMDAGDLERCIEADRAAGLEPWLIVASAGTTDTGAVDPIRAIAAIARRHDLWFHLDAAYGGFFLLCEPGREALNGIGLADSIVLDPHKGLSLPYGTGAVLIRDRRYLLQSNAYDANYMQDARQAAATGGQALSPADLSPELTRPFRGPRMWFPLRVFGLEAFRASIEEKLWLARYFHREISKMEGFEVGPFPDLSIVTYRYVPRTGDANDFNRRLQQAVMDDGRLFISSTTIEGKFTLRLAVLNFRTHRRHVDTLLALLKRLVPELESGRTGER
jgi:glutamate/tyrosine decarboxylase-like PLP-dependent enzyme